MYTSELRATSCGLITNSRLLSCGLQLQPGQFLLRSVLSELSRFDSVSPELAHTGIVEGETTQPRAQNEGQAQRRPFL